MPAPSAQPPSAWQLAQELGDALPDPADLSPESLTLVAAVRDLIAATVATDRPPNELAMISAEITSLTEALAATRREPMIALGRHPDGRIANFTQAGSGVLNPQSVPLDFEPIELPSTPGPSSVEVVAQCMLTDAHGGPPERAHGGIVATILDEAIGLAAVVANAPGLTAGLNVRFRGGTPLHERLTVRARYTHSDGRKHIATGELLAGGVVTAEAEGIFITPSAKNY